MYLNRGAYRELYLCLKDGMLLNRFKEFEPYKNSLYYMFTNFDLFSDKYDVEYSCKYMENVIRLVTRYNIDDSIINSELVYAAGSRTANLDMFFYIIYSIVEPKEMVRINIPEYVSSFYHILLDNFRENNSMYKNMKAAKYNNINIEEFKELMLFFNDCNLTNICSADDMIIRYCVLAVIVADTYANNKDYNNIIKFISNTEYYMSKLSLNGYHYENIKYSYDFLSEFYLKDLYNNIDNFINDSYGKKVIK